jgi:type I restriction enzyme, R subunit
MALRMTLSEADTRSKYIDPVIHARGWTEDLIRREETAGAIEIVGGQARKQAKGRTDITRHILITDQVKVFHIGFAMWEQSVSGVR